MPDTLDQVRPDWAWRPFEPDAARPWDRRTAAHLFRRAGYSANTRELDEAVKQSPREAVQRLVAGGQGDMQFDSEMNRLGRTMLATGNAQQLAAWWLHRAIRTPNPLHDKMTLFWHGHFATSAAKVTDAVLMFQQHQTLRKLGLGKFEPLAQAISRDPAMLIYLDSVTNRKRHPNENYARELMELFCLGLDQYTEQDIAEVARCFTGWEVRRGRFGFNRYQHDDGSKIFLGQTGRYGGEDAVRIVVAQPACPRFIARKLIRFFVCDDTVIPDRLVQPLADDFREHDLDISRLVERILSSELFFSEFSLGRKVRSPMEFAVGLLRCLEGSTNTITLAEALGQIGQSLFHPPSVKGWDGGRAWINSSSLLGRANLVSRMLGDDNTRYRGGDLAGLLDSYGIAEKETADWLLELLLATPVTDPTRQRINEAAWSTKGDRNRRISETIYAITLLPEFQLG